MQLTLPASTYKGFRALRAQAALFERVRGFDRSMRKLLGAADEPPPLAAVAELYAHWGDPPTQGTENFLRSCLAEAGRAEGPIVQCGASLLTLVLGGLCDNGEKTRQLWCLEHDSHWANVMRSWITQYRIGSAHVITSRARMFDGYVWYGVDTQRLAKGISLILCEGARTTPQGIIGALNRLDGRLGTEFTVLARGVSRGDDLRELKTWAELQRASCVVVDRQEGFVKLSRRTGPA